MDSTRPPGPALTGVARRERTRGPTLRVRLVVFVLATCGAVWLSALFDTLQDRDATLLMAERQHDNVAGALAEQAARALQATDLILQQAALLDPDAFPAFNGRAAIPDLLRRHMSGVPQVRNLFLFDPGRHLHLSSAPAGSANPDLSDRSYFIAQRDQPNLGLYVSEPFISRVTGDPTFVLSRRLGGPGFRGIAGASVDIGYIRRFYHALDLGAGSSIELLRADGVTLVSRERGYVASAPSRWLGALAALGNADARHMTLEHPLLGRARVSLRRVPGYPAVVAVGRTEHEILGVWRAKAWKNVARTFVITTLAAILLIAFLRQLERHERVTAQLHQSQKLEALGTLAGGIAHDFNNMLGAVLGYGELAQQDAAPGSGQRRYVDNIVLAANRARDLVARILAFSRPGINAPRPIVLQQVVRETIELMRLSLPHDVRVDTKLPEEPVVVMGDAAQLHQVVGNLLSNAVQAVDGNGRIGVSVEAIQVESTRDLAAGRLWPGDYGLLQVTDTGAGIAPDVFGRIFDPFFTTKPVGVGTGLGLSQVHASVLDHKGASAVDSAQGRGTQFRVYLPLTDQRPPLESGQAAMAQGHGEVVLVVDDDAVLVRLAEEVLASIGYEPVGCLGAQEALEVFRAQPK